MTGPLIVLDLPLKKDIQNVVTTTDAKVLLENKYVVMFLRHVVVSDNIVVFDKPEVSPLDQNK